LCDAGQLLSFFCLTPSASLSAVDWQLLSEEQVREAAVQAFDDVDPGVLDDFMRDHYATLPRPTHTGYAQKFFTEWRLLEPTRKRSVENVPFFVKLEGELYRTWWLENLTDKDTKKHRWWQDIKLLRGTTLEPRESHEQVDDETFDEVKRKTSRAGTAPHKLAGSRSCPIEGLTGSHPEYWVACPSPDPLAVRFRSCRARCVTYSVLNAMKATYRQAMALQHWYKPATGGLSDLSDPCRKVFNHSLRRQECPETLDELVECRDGMFIVVWELHSVAVNCTERKIYDSVEEIALDLTAVQLRHCGIRGIGDIRRLVPDTIDLVTTL
jgi:hypothetical protein